MAKLCQTELLAIPALFKLAGLANTVHMIDISEKFSHYRQRMAEAMGARKLTGEELADRIGAHSVTISKLKSGKMKLDDEWRARIAVGIGLPEEALFGYDPLPEPKPAEMFQSPKRIPKAPAVNDNRMIPLYGLAAGSLVGAHSVSSDLPEEVPCPPSLREVLGAYALVTTGESMVPRFFPGERLYVNPNQRVRPGDHVVIQTTTQDDNMTETWVKRFDSEDDAAVITSQYNPPGRIEFKRRYVRYVHRVMPINELF